MYRILHIFGVSLIAGLIGLGGALAADKPPATARPLGPNQLADLYGGKTWLWKDGAGYFAPDGKFLAWSGSGAKTNYASGQWTVSRRTGMLCMVAVWHNRWSGYPAKTCFKHVAADGNIYQRKSGGSDWYIFEHATVQQDDEFNKLVAGDEVTDTYKKAKLFVHRKALTLVPPNLVEFVK